MTDIEQVNAYIEPLLKAGVDLKGVMQHIGRLRDVTNAVIEATQQTDYPSVLLWRASCINSLIGVGEDGQLFHEVMIEHVAPDETEFLQHIKQELEKLNFPNVTAKGAW